MTDSRPPDETPRPDADAGPGLLTFTLEGRRAPALFLAGWLGTILGLGITVIGLLSQAGLAGGLLSLVGLGLLSAGLIAAAGSQAIERRAAARSAYVGPSPVVVFAAAIALTFFLVILVGTPLVAAGLDPVGPAAAFVSLIVTAFVYVALLRLLVVGTGSLTWRDLGVVPLGPRALTDALWGLVFAVPILFATGLLGLLLSAFLPVAESPLPEPVDGGGLLLNLVSAAVLAPIAEELFFRGFAVSAWNRQYGPRRALVQGAVFFALAHVITLGGSSAAEGFGLAAFAFAVRLPVALALGWLFLRRGTLYGPIALHAAFNALQVLALANAPAP